MTKIGLISDTHDFLDDQVFKYFENVDEIWHAGDFGNIELVEKLTAFKPLKGVFGNIDSQIIRSIYPENLIFNCEEVKVYMTHIGDYPPQYNSRSKAMIKENNPKLFISGHSHILKIMFDDQLNCLHMNPGAAGKQGWHKIKTLIRFVIDKSEIKNCEVIELGPR